MSAADRDFFVEHGHLVVRAAVEPARVTELSRALHALRAELPEPEPGTVWEAPGLSRMDPALAAHAHDARIGQLCADLLACEAVQLLQDTALVKAAHVGGAVAWHRDRTYTGYLVPPRLVSVRLALSACTLESGCLEVVDGSHRDAGEGELRPFTDAAIVELADGRDPPARRRVVALELEPGDISVHHGLTLHRSGPNRSARPRMTLITRLFDATCTLDPERLPEGSRDRFPVGVGNRLDEAAFPIVFRRRRNDSPRSV